MRILSLVVGLVLLGAPPLLTAAEPAPRTTLQRPEEWTTVFGEQAVKMRLAIAGESPGKGRLVWNLASAEGITIARGEAPSDGSSPVDLEVNIPPVKPGVVMTTKFTASLLPEGAKEPAAVYTSVVKIFPRDPFHDRRDGLKKLPIKLFDPSGNTAKVCTTADLPHERIMNAAVIGGLDEGVLILGEGISFREERGLWDRVLEAAGRGTAVICLAPAGGEMELPAPGSGSGKLTNIALARAGYVARLDKRLDERFWMATPADAKFSFVPGGRGARVAADVQSGGDGWCWIDMEFAPATPEKNARPPHVVVIALPLIEHWEAGPTPRFLVASLIDHLTLSPTSKAKERELVLP